MTEQPQFEIQLSTDRKTATIIGSEGQDARDIIMALVGANVRDVLDQCKTAAGVKRYYNACRATGNFSTLSEIAISERLKSLRGRLRSNDALWEFVETGMDRHSERVEIPEGETETPESFQKWVDRDRKKQLALEAAADNGGIPVLPTAEQVEAEKADSPQPFARGMAFTIINDAIGS